jgi:hypothetical protein
MIIAMNAQEEQNEGSKNALLHARSTFNDLTEFIGKPLTKSISQFGSKFPPYRKSSRELMGKKDYDDYTFFSQENAQMKTGQPTNIIFDNTILENRLPINATSARVLESWRNAENSAIKSYFAGYTGITIAGLTFFGVPILPAKPHFVSFDDFRLAQEVQLPNIPPNAFLFVGNMTESHCHCSACGIVGASKRSSKPQQQTTFAASIPGGYLEIFVGGACVKPQTRKYNFSIFGNRFSSQWLERIFRADKLSDSESKKSAQIILDDSVFNSLLQRCREIQPSTTAEKLSSLLQIHLSEIEIEKPLYIFLPEADPTKELVISENKPATYTGIPPDGVPNQCSNSFEKTAGSGGISGYYKGRIWTPATGFGNLLGRLELTSPNS